jgi:uncharacterized protein
VQRALAVDGSVLAVQGPPGTGKTHLGAEMIEALMRAGNAEVLSALTSGRANVAAGTAWLWSRAAMMAAVDVLFVDEAGQMSLANVLAAAPASSGLVLLGDPQQLEQPQKGVHPPGTSTSALGHILAGRATMEAEHGVFLEETYRMHPDVCGFISEVFYDGRVRPKPALERMRLDASEPLGGTGLRFVPVRHDGNRSESTEEAEVVDRLVRALLGGPTTWTDDKGHTRPLGPQDILVVAPYNAHVALLRKRLPAAVHVGTVDKFQGQEAPVVVYSMATSTPDDAPRGMEFLYSAHRLDVAISRARGAAFLVASPALFDVRCTSPRQMELVNAFCRYLELAREVTVR